MACWATPGRSGCARASRPSFASTRSSPTSSTCGATAGRRNWPPRSAGSTSTGRWPRCRSRPTATTRKPASSGTRSATAAGSITSTSPRPSEAGCTTFMPAPTAAGSSRSPGSWRPPSPRPRVAVLASNITWNAYNNFGGRSNYIHADKCPPTPTVNARMELDRGTTIRSSAHGTPKTTQPLSFDRPEPINHVPEQTQASPIRSKAARPATSRRPSGGCWAGWSARASTTTSTPKRNCTSASWISTPIACWCISTHPEYWSREMYLAVKSWVFERGGRLMYLGGNGLNCEVSFPDADTMVGAQRRQSQAAGRARSLRKPLRHARRERGEPAGRGLQRSRRDDRRAVSACSLPTIGSSPAPGSKRATLFGHAQRCTSGFPAAPSATRPTRSRPARPSGTASIWPRASIPTRAAARSCCFATPAGGGGVFGRVDLLAQQHRWSTSAVSRITANVLRRFSQ